jgi:hypothetical protein
MVTGAGTSGNGGASTGRKRRWSGQSRKGLGVEAWMESRRERSKKTGCDDVFGDRLW